MQLCSQDEVQGSSNRYVSSQSEITKTSTIQRKCDFRAMFYHEIPSGSEQSRRTVRGAHAGSLGRRRAGSEVHGNGRRSFYHAKPSQNPRSHEPQTHINLSTACHAREPCLATPQAMTSPSSSVIRMQQLDNYEEKL